ncbi:MAG: curlin protein [Porphyrobacter sp. HL-46]|nr:MAG: curlin protein [Porphyrobacter sp. HL-46]
MTNAAFSSRIATGLAACALLATAAAAQAQGTPERGVFVTQIGDAPRAEITQRNADSLARVAQEGANNQLDLTQEGSAAHRAEIAQGGDDNTASAVQDGEGSTDLALAQEGNGNSAILFQREQSALAETSATILQRGNGNSIILAQDGSDNEALLTQEGDNNIMTASQIDSGNRLEWNQIGDDVADLQIIQSGGATMQVTQSNGSGG